MQNRFHAFALLACLGLLLVGGSAEAREKAIPKTQEGFTKYMADRFAEALPGANVAIKGPLMLEVTPPKGPHEVYLTRVWEFCERDRPHCREEVDSFLVNMPGTIMESDTPIKPGDIRAVVRGAAYAEMVRKLAANGADHAGIVRPVAGDVWMICVVDRPHGISPLNHGELAKLGLTEDQAIALALKNLAANLPPLQADTHILKDVGLMFAAGNFYESSRMLLHDSWSEMSNAMHGHLVVAVPNPDFLIYGNGTGNGDRIALGGFAQTVLEKADKPITAQLFQWTPTGWEVVKPE